MSKFVYDVACRVRSRLEHVGNDIAGVFFNCFSNTMDTTVRRLQDGGVFVLTGDIPAMWLRDSMGQLSPYVSFAAQDTELAALIRGAVERQVMYVNLDPYANAFNVEPNGKGYRDDTGQSDWVWERKYEVDSLCAPLFLSHQLWKATGEVGIFGDSYVQMLRNVLRVFRTEQNHSQSTYRFTRRDCVKTDTLPMDGWGRPVNRTGMTWSGFRPSDDCCDYGYLIPSNMMAVSALRKGAEIARTFYPDAGLEAELLGLAGEIEDGIETYGRYLHPKYGWIYAYETDGYGNYNLMDDANSPSLLGLPLLGYRDSSDTTYQNTRRFILSPDNPYYYAGKYGRGVGSPHTPSGHIWPMSLIVQAMTSRDDAEIQSCLSTLLSTTAGTNLMHESFCADDARIYTRPWFGWANSLFGELILELEDEGFFERGTGVANANIVREVI